MSRMPGVSPAQLGQQAAQGASRLGQQVARGGQVAASIGRTGTAAGQNMMQNANAQREVERRVQAQRYAMIQDAVRLAVESVQAGVSNYAQYQMWAYDIGTRRDAAQTVADAVKAANKSADSGGPNVDEIPPGPPEPLPGPVSDPDFVSAALQGTVPEPLGDAEGYGGLFRPPMR